MVAYFPCVYIALKGGMSLSLASNLLKSTQNKRLNITLRKAGTPVHTFALP